MTATIIRFPRAHLRSVKDEAPIMIRDMKATIDSLDADIAEVDRRNRTARRALLAIGPRAKARLEEVRRQRLYQKQMDAVRDLFNGPYA